VLRFALPLRATKDVVSDAGRNPRYDGLILLRSRESEAATRSFDFLPFAEFGKVYPGVIEFNREEHSLLVDC
jgi:hypothetical protein